MRTKTVKRTGKIRKVKKPLVVTIDDKKLAEFVASQMYKVIISFNLKTFECETDDLKTAILSFKETPVTEMYITIRKGQAIFEKIFSPINARKLFKDEQYLDIFLNTFKGLYG